MPLPNERKIQEVNTGTYALQSPMIFPLLKEIGSRNAQGEYYLPDLAAIGRKKAYALDSLCLRDSSEARGVNTPTELEALENLILHRQTKASPGAGSTGVANTDTDTEAFNSVKSSVSVVEAAMKMRNENKSKNKREMRASF